MPANPVFTDVVSISTTDGRAAGLTECAIIAIAGETRPNYGIEKTCQIWKTRLEYGLQQLEKRKQRTHFGLLLWQSGACNRPQEKVPRIWIQIPQRGLLNHIMPAARAAYELNRYIPHMCLTPNNVLQYSKRQYCGFDS